MRILRLAFVLMLSYGATDCLSLSQTKLDEVPLSVSQADVVEGADFALQEIQQRSDSGVYETLRIARIIDAAYVKGLYHSILKMNLTLASEHLLNYPNDQESRHHIMIMTAHETGLKTIAIDEYPEMKPESIELYKKMKILKAIEQREKLWSDVLEDCPEGNNNQNCKAWL
eukprot:CAMPEP_0204831728 /NCGR_PEP_ID=MMETSP1346-20131115/11384_1 /ASSEMBLY_ACC=CAM_ASM_000771 /TAXON_ID=215587 /ORGANISM="Aplanochytrium stocchinoi, Strain GSBS06" /LENGTH=170 /DNA_ID=CAMNT_0051962975 /DNA_START=55 /DNA_END=567 /DNA_ORIENTATION=-